MPKRGIAFTLIELLLVVTVIITLALIAIPTYNKSKQRAIQKEAISNMKLIAAAERIYKMETSAYAACSCVDAADCVDATLGCNTLLKLMLNTSNWKYNVDATPPSCQVRAVAQSGSCVYTLIDSDFDSKDFSSSSGCI